MRVDTTLRRARVDPAVIFASLGANTLSLAVPMAMIHIYDRIIPNFGYETLTVLALAVLGAIAAEVALRTARRVLLEQAGERFSHAAYLAAIRSLLESDPAHEGDEVSQGRLFRCVGSIERLRTLHVGEVSMAFLDLPFACLFLGIIALISPTIGLTVVGILLVAFPVLRMARRRVLNLQIERTKVEERRHSFLMEVLGGVETIKGLQIEPFMKRRYERLTSGSAKVSASMARSIQMAQSFTASIGTLAPLLIGAMGAFLVISGDMTVGSLAAVVLLTGRIIQPALKVEAFMAGMANVRQEREDLEDVVTLPGQLSGAHGLSRIDQLSLNGVNAQQGSKIAFRNVFLTIARGDCIAITGGDRRARTAFLELLMGEFEVTGGTLTLNGRSYSDYSLADRRRHIRYFSAENALIAGSLIENMTQFQPAEHRDEAIALASRLGIEDTIYRSAEGFELLVGSGAKSALPKSLADAILVIGGLVNTPDVILFDEANAALDFDTDNKLLDELKRRRPDTIIVLVSNRPSYLRMATRSVDIDAFLVPTQMEAA